MNEQNAGNPLQPVVTYRLATEADFPIIKEFYILLNKHFYSLGYRLPHPENIGDIYLDSFRRTLGKFSNAWVAEVDSKVVAYVLCRIKRAPQYMGGVLVGEISDEWVDESARRLRIGDRLCRIGLQWMREQNVHSVEIQVLNSNEASWKMLNRMGFEQEFRVGRLLWDEYKEDQPTSNQPTSNQATSD
jgi:ribosomal protein S18 acetylase RimI-like enzyme